jgi:hypothetical protein
MADNPPSPPYDEGMRSSRETSVARDGSMQPVRSSARAALDRQQIRKTNPSGTIRNNPDAARGMFNSSELSKQTQGNNLEHPDPVKPTI